MIRTICLTLLLGLTSFASHALGTARDDAAGDVAPKRHAKPHFKGVELYSQHDAKGKEWRFGWLPGTNRLKTAEEVNASLKIVGVKALKRELATFAENEHVLVIENGSPLIPNGVELKWPNEKVLKELKAFCESRKIRFDCLSLEKD